ncbi:hypothetical protein L6164_025886 [Bauhinia variegata]|uniref:Uncharacterized protein n=1 Tax=Bauhinia variegata TaxID=167791 RepID=A0ACB9M3I2_BAUVA|nr:hypothetical protein L6164_025886 [Bauhinia variegata]
MALRGNSEQPGSKSEQKDNRIEISRNSVQQRCGQNHEEREGSTRQEITKLSPSKSTTSLPSRGLENIWFDTEKLPSEHNITVESSDECKNASFHVDHGTPKLEELVGRDTEATKLVQFCTEKKSNLSVIVVTRVAGIGKAYLAEAIYKKVKRQFNCCAWVDMLGKSTLNVFQDMLNLFSKTQPVSCPPSNASTIDEASLRKTFSSFLTEKVFLLVLDDISSQEDWTSVKEALPQNNRNGRVIMTSRLSKLFRLYTYRAGGTRSSRFLQSALEAAPAQI